MRERFINFAIAASLVANAMWWVYFIYRMIYFPGPDQVPTMAWMFSITILTSTILALVFWIDRLLGWE